MLGVLIDRHSEAHHDHNGAVKNSLDLISVSQKKHQQIDCHCVQENVAMDTCFFGWIVSKSDYVDPPMKRKA